MTRFMLAACALLLPVCPTTLTRHVDAPRPAFGCTNSSTVAVLSQRILQDIEGGGCLVIYLDEGSHRDTRGLDLDIEGEIGLGFERVARFPMTCTQLTEPPEDPNGAHPAEIGGGYPSSGRPSGTLS